MLGLALSLMLGFADPAWEEAPRAVPKPSPAPARFASDEYGVAAVIPPGLVRCARPKEAVTSDHGFVVFMVAPKDCAYETLSGALPPAMAVFYGYSTPEDVEPGFDRLDDATAALHMAQRYCGKGKVAPSALRLAGRPTAQCRKLTGQGRVSLELTARYSPGPGRGSAALTASLETTPEREAADRRLFLRLARSVRLCRPSDAPPNGSKLDCRSLGRPW
ncbi:MAG: hypothetical protein JSR45_00930 [Proteobacteria bacterium]|nr:hypothetical protein [Pseudomonadota bacterium]